MPQSLLIFRKDVRHLWPEILVVLALFAAFAFSAPSGWTSSQYVAISAILAPLLKVLMPIAWIVMISRLIHDEPLVGDRQFWTSRPYHWAKLLLAKVLFLLAFIYLPFLIMQVYLLKRAGLHPMLSLPALGHNLLLLTVILIVPISALAAVTSTFPRLLLATLGGLLYILVLSGIVAYFVVLHMQPLHWDWLLKAIFILIPAAVLLYQYKTRDSRTSRVALIATPLLTAVLVLVIPSTTLNAHAYPVLTGTGAPTLTSLAGQFHPPITGRLRSERNMVLVNLPVSAQNVPEDVNFRVQGVRVTLTAPGVNYTSPFLAASGNTQINASSPAVIVPFPVPLDLFNRIHDLPVDVHLQLATEHLRADKPQTWKATLLPFNVPGNGLCTFSPDDVTLPPTCRYPLVQPEISFVTAPLANGSCPSTSPRPIPGRASIGGNGASLDFDPVITVPLAFRTGDPDQSHNYLLCPGTDLTFVEATSLPNVSLTVDQKQMVLDPFAMRFTPPAETSNPAPIPQ